MVVICRPTLTGSLARARSLRVDAAAASDGLSACKYE